MITDEAVEGWLARIADEVPLPVGGLEAALAVLADAPRTRRVSRSHPSWAKLAVAGAAAAFVVAAGAVSLVHDGGGSSSSSARSGSAPSAASAKQVTPDLTSLPGATSVHTPAAAQRIVRTAAVVLTAPAGQVAAELAKVRALAGSSGYVSDSTTSLAGSDPGGTITLRIPSAQYVAVRDALAGGQYGTVISLREQGQDVTAQYTDLGARITALEATRASYLVLLSRATSISDVLSVQAQLTQVQQQIEQLQGQQKVLADQSDDATITVTVGGPVAAAHHRAGWSAAVSRAGHSLVDAGQGLVAASGVALVVVTLVVLTAAGVLVYRRVRRRLI